MGHPPTSTSGSLSMSHSADEIWSSARLERARTLIDLEIARTHCAAATLTRGSWWCSAVVMQGRTEGSAACCRLDSSSLHSSARACGIRGGHQLGRVVLGGPFVCVCTTKAAWPWARTGQDGA